MPKQPFNKRRVPWHAPFPILKRRGTIARFSRKHGKPSAEQQDAAIAAAGIQPIAEPAQPAINHDLRRILGGEPVLIDASGAVHAEFTNPRGLVRRWPPTE